MKPIVSIAASLVIIIFIGIIRSSLLEEKPITTPLIINSSQGIVMAKIELPKETTASMDMIGLIVYQGRVYTQTGTKVRPQSAESLLGEKLGTKIANNIKTAKYENFESLNYNKHQAFNQLWRELT